MSTKFHAYENYLHPDIFELAYIFDPRIGDNIVRNSGKFCSFSFEYLEKYSIKVLSIIMRRGYEVEIDKCPRSKRVLCSYTNNTYRFVNLTRNAKKGIDILNW